MEYKMYLVLNMQCTLGAMNLHFFNLALIVPEVIFSDGQVNISQLKSHLKDWYVMHLKAWNNDYSRFYENNWNMTLI